MHAARRLLLLFLRLPDLNCELPILVGIAGPQPRAPDLTGHYRTSPARSKSQLALPHLNRERQSSVCWTSTAALPTEIWRLRLRSGSAHVRENVRVDAKWNAREDVRTYLNIRQIKCQTECQIECQSIRQNIFQVESHLVGITRGK